MSVKNKFVFVANNNEIKENSAKKVFAEDEEIALIKIEGEVYALNNVCPHQHASIIHQGFIEEGCVVCPAHGWEFDIKTGKRKNGLRGLKKYEVKISDDKIFVKLEKKNSIW
jgi:NAD(P)H-dependent nitrite reductase small subunit